MTGVQRVDLDAFGLTEVYRTTDPEGEDVIVAFDPVKGNYVVGIGDGDEWLYSELSTFQVQSLVLAVGSHVAWPR